MNFIILCTSDGEQPALFLGAASQLKSIWGRSCLDLVCTEGSLHWVVTATTGFCFYWSFQVVGSTPAGVSVWFPFWNQLLESMGFASGSCCLWKPPGVSRRGGSGSSGNGLVLCQPCQLLWGGQPAPGAAPAPRGLLCRPLTEEKGLAEQLGWEVFLGHGGTRELQRCPRMLCRADCIQTCDIGSRSAAKLLTASVKWSCAMWRSCATQSCAKPGGPVLYHWSYSGWLCESACIMEIGRFPPHSSLFFRKHKSQRDKLLSRSLCTFIMKNGLVARTAFTVVADVPNRRTYILGCCSLATLGDRGAGLPAGGLLGLSCLFRNSSSGLQACPCNNIPLYFI